MCTHRSLDEGGEFDVVGTGRVSQGASGCYVQRQGYCDVPVGGCGHNKSILLNLVRSQVEEVGVVHACLMCACPSPPLSLAINI